VKVTFCERAVEDCLKTSLGYNKISVLNSSARGGRGQEQYLIDAHCLTPTLCGWL